MERSWPEDEGRQLSPGCQNALLGVYAADVREEAHSEDEGCNLKQDKPPKLSSHLALKYVPSWLLSGLGWG